MKPLCTLILFCAPLMAQVAGPSQSSSSNAGYGNPPAQNSSGTYNSGTYNNGTSSSANARVVIPSGTVLHVRVNEALSSESAQSGDRFTGTLSDPIQVDGRTVFPRGSDVAGRVMSATPSGRLSNSGALELAISSIRFNGQTANISSTPLVMKGESHTRSNTAKMGGGAALGAIIGGIAGGGKGAAIGATVGAGAGAAGAAATGSKPATVESEAVLNFSTSNDTTVYISPATQAQIDSGAQNDSRSNDSRGNDSRQNIDPGTQSTNSDRSYPDSPYPNSTNSQDDPPVLRRHDESPVDSTNSQNSNSGNVGVNPNTTVQTNCNVGSNAFSLRDRRVIRSCMAGNNTAPGSTTSTIGTTAPFAPGTVLPANVQRSAIPLPLSCERQLAPAAANTERVLYGRQVLLIDNNARVLDAFSLDQ